MKDYTKKVIPHVVLICLLLTTNTTSSLAQTEGPGRIVASTGQGLIMLNTDGSNVINLTENAGLHAAPRPPNEVGSDDYHPSVSANGIIAFQSAHNSTDGTHHTGSRIYVLHPDGSIKQLTTNDGLHIDAGSGMYPNDINPVISPDGNKVCFIGARNEETETSPGVFTHPWRDIYVVNTDGTGLHQVTQSQYKAGSGANYSSIMSCVWSPDSSTIAFKGLRLLTDPDNQMRFHVVLGTIKPNGTIEPIGTEETPIPLVDNVNWLGSSGATSEQALDWSPDGRYILVEYGGGAMGSPSPRYIILDTGGGGYTELNQTQLGPSFSMVAGSVRFSPDSQKIVYLSDNASYTASYLTFININGTNRTVLSNLQIPRGYPIWWMSGPAVPEPAKLELVPNPVRIFQGGPTFQVTPTLYDALGNIIVHGVRSWAIDPYYLGSPAVSYTGAVVDRGTTAQGTFTLTATNTGMSANTTVIVGPPSPLVKLTPGSLSFSAETGTFSTLATELKNYGSADLTISSIDRCEGTSPEFTWIPIAPVTLAPGSTANLSVTYEPVDKGGDSGCLSISSNDPINPVTSLVVSAVNWPTPPTGSLYLTTFRGQVVVDADGVRRVTRNGASGDEIAVFDGSGTLCGHAMVAVDGSYIVTVYGDDPATTDFDEGAIAGETLTFRMWDRQRQRELPIRTLQLNGSRQVVIWSSGASGIVNLHALAQSCSGSYESGIWYLDFNGNGVWDGTPTDGMYTFGAGLTGAIPVTGDWTGTGTSKFGVFHGGTWYVDLNDNGTWDGTPTDSLYIFGAGLTGATPVTGDWTGTGTSKIGVFHDGTWYVDLNDNGAWDGTPTDGMYIFGAGLTGALPVIGDWNGDSSDKIGVYENAMWFLDVNGNSTWDGEGPDLDLTSFFGSDAMRPVIGVWQ